MIASPGSTLSPLRHRLSVSAAILSALGLAVAILSNHWYVLVVKRRGADPGRRYIGLRAATGCSANGICSTASYADRRVQLRRSLDRHRVWGRLFDRARRALGAAGTAAEARERRFHAHLRALDRRTGLGMATLIAGIVGIIGLLAWPALGLLGPREGPTRWARPIAGGATAVALAATVVLGTLFVRAIDPGYDKATRELLGLSFRGGVGYAYYVALAAGTVGVLGSLIGLRRPGAG